MTKEEILKRLREVESKTPDPMVYAIINLIEGGRAPESALLEGFLAATESLRSAMEAWKKHLESAPVHSMTVTLERPSEDQKRGED